MSLQGMLNDPRAASSGTPVAPAASASTLNSIPDPPSSLGKPATTYNIAKACKDLANLTVERWNTLPELQKEGTKSWLQGAQLGLMELRTRRRIVESDPNSLDNSFPTHPDVPKGLFLAYLMEIEVYLTRAYYWTYGLRRTSLQFRNWDDITQHTFNLIDLADRLMGTAEEGMDAYIPIELRDLIDKYNGQ